MRKNNFDSWDSSPVEKEHLHFYKSYLGVNRKASNIVCRSETGSFPLKLNIDTQVINNWIRLNSLDDNTLVKQPLIMSENLYQRGYFSYHSGVYKL